MSSSYWVYAITDESGSGLTKIGIAKDMTQRMQQYRTHNPTAQLRFTMELAGADQSDAELVERMSFFILARRRRGGEWFECPAEIAKHAISAAADVWAVLIRNANLLADGDGEVESLLDAESWAHDWFSAKVRHVRDDLENMRRVYAPFLEAIERREMQARLLAAAEHEDDKELYSAIEFFGVPDSRCSGCSYLFKRNPHLESDPCLQCGSTEWSAL